MIRAAPILDPLTHQYRLLDGEPLTSVSAVVNALIRKSFDGVNPAILKNAAERGMLLEEYATDLLRDGYVTTRPNERADVIERLEGFERWWMFAKPTFIDAQRMVFSEIDKTAGTEDWLLKLEGKYYIVDCKCTAQAERAWILQLGGYLTMDTLPIDGAAVLHVNPKYRQGYKWLEYDPEEAMMHWQRGLAWYRSLQMLRAETVNESE